MNEDAETGTIVVHNKTYDLAQLSKEERHRQVKTSESGYFQK